MPRLASGEKCNDQFNIPMPRKLKRRILDAAKRFPGQPKPTRYARMLMEQAIERAEKNPAAAVPA